MDPDKGGLMSRPRSTVHPKANYKPGKPMIGPVILHRQMADSPVGRSLARKGLVLKTSNTIPGGSLIFPKPKVAFMLMDLVAIQESYSTTNPTTNIPPQTSSAVLDPDRTNLSTATSTTTAAAIDTTTTTAAVAAATSIGLATTTTTSTSSFSIKTTAQSVMTKELVPDAITTTATLSSNEYTIVGGGGKGSGGGYRVGGPPLSSISSPSPSTSSPSVDWALPNSRVEKKTKKRASTDQSAESVCSGALQNLDTFVHRHAHCYVILQAPLFTDYKFDLITRLQTRYVAQRVDFLLAHNAEECVNAMMSILVLQCSPLAEVQHRRFCDVMRRLITPAASHVEFMEKAMK